MRGVAIGLLVLLGASPALGEEAMRDVLRAYIEVWNTGELPRLDDLLTEDFKRHGGFGPADSRAQLKSVIENSRDFYRDLHIELYDAVANPDKGAMRWRFTGGWADTRFEVDALNFGMYHFVDGKISQEWVLGNNMDVFRTFGYRLTPPQYEIVPPPIEQPPGPTLAERMQPHTGELASFAEGNRRDAPKNAGDLEIATEVGCHLSLDGERIGWLEPQGSVALRLGRGEHRLRATSLGGSVFFEESVAVRKGASVSVAVEAPAKIIAHPRRRTAEDLRTGLMWQMADNGEDATKTAADAYCDDLAQGGFSDWRLPSIHELQSLHSPTTSKRYHSINGVQLSDCCPWTSTPQGDYYWTYAFSLDMRYLQYETLGWHMRALCVRDTAAALSRSLD